jgi:hypothetical protein
MTIYICPDCGHMPAEHGPEGCVALNRAAVTSPNPAVRSGQVEISGGGCGCRAMLSGELVGSESHIPRPGATEAKRERVDYASPSHLSPGQLTTQGGQPVGFDIENFQPGQRMEGHIARKEVKAMLWVNKVPFEVSAPPQRRNKPAQFMVARKDGSMPPPDQWWVPVRLLTYRNDGSGSFGYKMQADGEGGSEVEEHILTFDCGSEWRDQQMNALAQYVQEAGRAGPFRLDQGQNSGQGAAPWVIKNWRPEDAGFAPSHSAPAPVAAPVPSPVAAPAPPPVPSTPPPVPPAPPPTPAPPPPPADPYQYADRYDGVKIRWKPGMADWEVVPDTRPATPVVQAQPLASTRTVVGLNPGDRMEGAARIAVEQADGTQIRQIHYQGDGVVVTPQGVPTQMAAGTEPRTREEAITGKQGPQTAATVPGALGVEEPAYVSPGQAPAPTQAATQSAIRQAYDSGSPIPVEMICDHPDHTDNGGSPAHVTMPAFWDPSASLWKQTHNCPGSKRVRVLDATAAVKAAAGVA